MTKTKLALLWRAVQPIAADDLVKATKRDEPLPLGVVLLSFDGRFFVDRVPGFNGLGVPSWVYVITDTRTAAQHAFHTISGAKGHARTVINRETRS